MNKTFKNFLRSMVLVVLILPLAFIFSACASVSVVNIEKTNSTDLVDIYTVYYSNGKTSSISVTHGEDGEDFDAEQLFEYGVQKGYYTDDLDGYKQFLTDLSQKSTSQTVNAKIGKALQSTVSIYTQFPVIYSSEVDTFCGGGVIYKMENEYSYILTNYHVVYYSSSATEDKLPSKIYLYQYGANMTISGDEENLVFGGDFVEAVYVGGSSIYDLAVLKAKTSDLLKVNSSAQPVEIAESYTVGQTVYAIGNPEGEGMSVSKGIISVESEEISMNSLTGGNQKQSFRVMRLDVAINGGNSGGGLFNENGQLVGIVNAKMTLSSSGSVIDGISYAIPFENLTKVVQNILHYSQNGLNSVYKITLGIQTQIYSSKQVYNPASGEIKIEEQIMLASTPKYGSIAYSFGTTEDERLKEGDIITHITINDVSYKLTRSYQLREYLLTVYEGDKISLTFMREGVEKHTGSHTVLLTELNEIA